MSARRAIRFVAVLVAGAAVALAATAAAAQDFGAALPAGPQRSALAMIEHGLARAESGLAFESAWTSWHGLPDLTTRAAALGLGAGPVAAALGVSQSGDSEIGWSALGAACGLAGDAEGAALRAVGRRDHNGFAGALGAGVGVEIGAAAWMRAGAGLELWASAPQLWTRGASPPLARALTLGVRTGGAGWSAWLARAAPAHPLRGDGDHSAGIGIEGGPWRLWLDARDHPLRGGLGLGASIGVAALGAHVESHPVLGETVRLGVLFGAGAR